MVYAQRRITGLYAFRRHSAAPGFHSPRSATPPTAHSTHSFLCPETATQFLYRAQKTVAYSRNVMRNNFSKKIRRIHAAYKEIIQKYIE
jgi:hypothetical protein